MLQSITLVTSDISGTVYFHVDAMNGRSRRGRRTHGHFSWNYTGAHYRHGEGRRSGRTRVWGPTSGSAVGDPYEIPSVPRKRRTPPTVFTNEFLLCVREWKDLQSLDSRSTTVHTLRRARRYCFEVSVPSNLVSLINKGKIFDLRF